MKNFILLMAGFLVSSSAMAAEKISSENRVAAETMLRQVLDKKLMKGSVQNEDILRALEGSGDSTTSDEIVSLSCERGLGSDYCEVGISGLLNNGKGDEPEFSFVIEVRIYQGKVLSAKVTNYAG